MESEVDQLLHAENNYQCEQNKLIEPILPLYYTIKTQLNPSQQGITFSVIITSQEFLNSLRIYQLLPNMRVEEKGITNSNFQIL